MERGRDQGAKNDRKHKKRTKKRNTQWVCTYGEGRHNYQCRINENKESRREDEKEKNLDEYRSPCTDNLDPTLNTNTADPQGFGFAAANPVYGPYEYLEGSPGMNQRASEVHWA